MSHTNFDYSSGFSSIYSSGVSLTSFISQYSSTSGIDSNFSSSHRYTCCSSVLTESTAATQSSISELGCNSESYPSSSFSRNIGTDDRTILFKPRTQTFSEEHVLRKLLRILKAVTTGCLSLASLGVKILGMTNNPQKQTLTIKGLEICRIMEISCQLLSTSQIAYHRDIYYRHKTLFRSVENVRSLCNKVAFYFDVPPARLNIISCPKGLMFGYIKIELVDGSKLDFSSYGRNSLPHASYVHKFEFSRRITTVLIVEKETVFFALIQSGIQARFPEVIIVSGKGYPDTNTREILHALTANLKVCILVDYDPDGAHIYQVYAEGGWNQKTYPILHASWAGLHCSMSRIGRWGLNTDQLIEFTPRDRSLASKLVAHWTNNINLRRVMLRMLYRGKKVELEAVTQFRHMLLQYLHVVIRSEN